MPRPSVTEQQLARGTHGPHPGDTDTVAASDPSPASTPLAPLSTSTPSSPARVLDHRAFPHIMDAIIAACDLPTLSNVALTCRQYIRALDPLGSHCVFTRQGDDLAVAPFRDPSAVRVPTAFPRDSQCLPQNKGGGDSEALRRVRLVDIHLDQVSEDEGEELRLLVRPTVVRTRCFIPLEAKVYIHIINNVASYNHTLNDFMYNTSAKLIYDTQGGEWDDDFRHGCWYTGDLAVFKPADKIVLVVNYSPRVAPRWPDFVTTFSAPMVLHFVEMDDTALGHTERTQSGFTADEAHNVVSAILWDHSGPITVVGMETITPWEFNKYWLKDKIAHLDPNAREEHIRCLLSNNDHCDISLLRFLTVEEYAREVSPAMFALERGEGFCIPPL